MRDHAPSQTCAVTGCGRHKRAQVTGPVKFAAADGSTYERVVCMRFCAEHDAELVAFVAQAGADLPMTALAWLYAQIDASSRCANGARSEPQASVTLRSLYAAPTPTGVTPVAEAPTTTPPPVHPAVQQVAMTFGGSQRGAP